MQCKFLVIGIDEETKEYINPDLEDATNNMLEEYIEKAYKINELVVEMEPFYSNRRPIPTQ